MPAYTPTDLEINEALRRNVQLAYKLAPNCLDDLIGVGNLAIMQSTVSYDPTKGASFANHAAQYIKRNQWREFTSICKGVHIPHDVSDYPERAGKIGNRYELDAPIDDGDHENEEGRYAILNSRQSLAYVLSGPDDLIHELNECLAELRAEERQILKLLFYDGIEQQELAAMIGVHRTSLHNAVNEILKTLRKKLGR